MNSEEYDLALSGGEDDVTQKHYRILNQNDIGELQETDISTVSSLLSVSRDVACNLLLEKNWDLTSFNDDWFASDNDDMAPQPVKVLGKRKAIGQVCNICFDKISDEDTVSAACGHPFCDVCLKTYIVTSINDGPGCLMLRCPEPACKAFVGLKLVDKLLSGDERDKYYIYLYRSYVERSRIRKWCPAPGCSLAVEINDTIGESYEVTCRCGYKFCWKCAEESHRPINCATVAKWLEKNSSEKENRTWILAYTKPCPQCKKPIEKNQGCNQMTCPSPCNNRFCRVCLRPLIAHHASCNRFREGDTSIARDERRRKNARKSLEQYRHFYERWDMNDKSRKRALIDLSHAKNEHVDVLAKMQGNGPGKFGFVIEAWEQIVECRRVLKWTYAYGYYLSLDGLSKNKMNLFECLQGEAETALERLHHCAEKEIEKYLKAPQMDFKNFNAKLTSYTGVTRKYFENLVRAMENNLAEVKT